MNVIHAMPPEMELTLRLTLPPSAFDFWVNNIATVKWLKVHPAKAIKQHCLEYNDEYYLRIIKMAKLERFRAGISGRYTDVFNKDMFELFDKSPITVDRYILRNDDVSISFSNV